MVTQAASASAQDGTYPRPQMVRPRWVDLTGEWEFDYGEAADEASSRPREQFGRTIVVPFPPESRASGLGDTGYHPVVWYRRSVTAEDVAGTGRRDGDRLLLHFGAVDYRADVWAGGQHVGYHEGGHTPFTVDVSEAGCDFDVVVRAEDDPLDLEQPRGKQDWQPAPHIIWYQRTTGIWQPVWMEAVSPQHLNWLGWTTEVACAEVTLSYETALTPEPGTAVRVSLTLGDSRLADVTAAVASRRGDVKLVLDALANGQDLDRCLWSPESPTLLDAVVRLISADGVVIDEVASYVGLRTISASHGRLLLNGRPHYTRAVLSQGYWPQSHLAAPSAKALRDEVALIKEMGFNTARLHQKIEDPRWLYWADRLGLLVWGEMPSAYGFSGTSVARLTREWQEAVRRDMSHPCVVAWVPMNESWGAQQAAECPQQRHLLQALYHLTKALDPTRPVISNDGWEHADSDILTIHDYNNDARTLAASYSSTDVIVSSARGIGPGGKVIRLLPEVETPGLRDAPVIVSEFGGVALDPSRDDGSWGYAVVPDEAHLEAQLRAVIGALRASPALAGWCYTQLTDTLQEANGLTDPGRRPKLDVAILREIVAG